MEDDKPDQGPEFVKSSYSAANCNCVEVALPRADGLVAVRDSESSADQVLTFSRTAWSAFIADIRDGRWSDHA